jgi:hypothetical protein
MVESSRRFWNEAKARSSTSSKARIFVFSLGVYEKNRVFQKVNLDFLIFFEKNFPTETVFFRCKGRSLLNFDINPRSVWSKLQKKIWSHGNPFWPLMLGWLLKYSILWAQISTESHPRSGTYSVKISLRLSVQGKNFQTGEGRALSNFFSGTYFEVKLFCHNNGQCYTLSVGWIFDSSISRELALFIDSWTQL